MEGMTRRDMTVPEAYYELGFYVCERAVKDYKLAIMRGNKWEIEKLERFFRSEWCYFLTDGKVDGEQIITEVRKWTSKESLKATAHS